MTKIGNKIGWKLLCFSIFTLFFFNLIIQFSSFNLNNGIPNVSNELGKTDLQSNESIEPVWNITLDGGGNDYGYAIAVDGSGVYAVGSVYQGANQRDIILVKYDTKGNLIWDNTLGVHAASDTGYDVAVDSSGIYIVGQIYNSTSGYDAIIAKYDIDGNQIWNTTLSFPNYECGYGIAVDGGGVYITGKTNSTTMNDFDAFIACYAHNGTFLWYNAWGYGDDEEGFGIAADSSGIYISGTTGNTTDHNVFIAKYDRNGNHIMNNTWGTESHDYGYGIDIDSSGIYQVGTSYIEDANGDFLIVKYDFDGTISYYRIWGTEGTDFLKNIVLDGSGIYTIGGSTSPESSNDVYLIKLDFDGYTVWDTFWDGGDSNVDYGYDIAVDGSGIYIVGKTENVGSNWDILILKYTNNYMQTCLWEEDYYIWDGPDYDGGQGIAIDGGGIYITGSTQSYGPEFQNAFLAKFNVCNHEFDWNVTWGINIQDSDWDIAIDSSGIYIVGTVKIATYDVLLARYTNNGTQLWNTTWDSGRDDYGYGVAIDGSGVYIVGKTASAGFMEGFLVCYDIDGTEIWNKTWGSINNNYNLYGVAVDGSGIYTVGNYNNNVYLARHNANKTEIWNTTWGSTDVDVGRDVAVDSSGVYIVGETKSFAQGAVSALVIRYFINGTQIWNSTWGYNNDAFGKGIALSGSGIYITGLITYDASGIDDAFMVKYNHDGNNIFEQHWGGSEDDEGYDIVMDSSGIYVVGVSYSYDDNIRSCAMIIQYRESTFCFSLEEESKPLLIFPPTENNILFIILMLGITGAVIGTFSVILVQKKHRTAIEPKSKATKGETISHKLTSQAKYIGMSDLTLDVKLKGIIRSQIPFESIKDIDLQNFFKQELSFLSKNEITRVMQLDIPDVSEKIAILEELANLSPEDREKFIKTLENLKNNF